MTTTIPTLPPTPDRSDPATFSPRSDALLGALDPWAVAVQAVGDEAEAAAVAAAASADDATTNGAAQVALATTQASYASANAAEAAGHAAMALSSANHKGNWSTLSGHLNLPASVSHGATTWLLLTDLADVATSQPGVTADWQEIGAAAGALPIGTLLPFTAATTNPVVYGGATWLKTGTVAARSTYPSGPGCISTQGVIDKAVPNTAQVAYASYANGLFVLNSPTASRRGLWTSPDGFAWTYRTFASALPVDLSYCAHGAGVYVFQTTAATPTVYVTSDLVTFSAVTLPNTAYALAAVASISFNNGLFVYCCSNTSVAYLYTSTNGTTWTQRTLPNAYPYFGCAYGLGKWVVTCQAGATSNGAYSSDGTTWTNIAHSGYTVGSAPTFANGIFICLQNTGANALTSSNGTSFTANALSGVSGSVGAPAWTGTKFLLPAYSGAFYASSSGTGSWSQLTTSGLVSVNLSAPISNGAGVVCACGGGTASYTPLYVSADHMASTWCINPQLTAHASYPAASCGDANLALSLPGGTGDLVYLLQRSGINYRSKQITTGIAQTGNYPSAAWNGSVYVVTLGAGSSTAAKSSPDGVTWTARTLSKAAPNNGSRHLAALTTNGRFVLVNDSTTGSTSTDGATWSDTATLPAAFAYLYSNGSTLLAMGNAVSNTYYTSSDGVIWTTRNFPGGLTPNPGGIFSDQVSCFALPPASSNGVYATYVSTDAITWTYRALPASAGSALVPNCAGGVTTDKAVSPDYGITWYTTHGSLNYTALRHNCLNMSLGGTSVLDATTLLTGVDVMITSNIAAGVYPAIPNYVRVA